MVKKQLQRPHILVLDHHKTTQSTLRSLFPEAIVSTVSHASRAVDIASETKPDIIIMELSLAGHSGFEFLYEFRTYSDWTRIPVFIYSTLKVSERVQKSRAWNQLGIVRYLYKPETSLASLRSVVEKTGLLTV